MYGFTQARCLENDLLTEHMNPKVYYQFTHTPELWRHKLHPILFSLVLYNSGVKYVGKEHAYHLITAIREFYPVTVDWTEKLCFSITLNWEYQKLKVDSSMPGYVAADLHKYQHTASQKQKYSPHRW